jgi:hypothetical protein
MARLRFRDRFLTPPVARAITSPLGILLAGAGAAVGIVAGLPVIAAAGIGAAAWAVRVAVAIPRAPAQERIDPFTLRDPWRQFVREALDAQRRFDRAVQRAAAGPLRDRLSTIADRLDTGVRECWRIAQHGQDLVDARTQMDVEGARRELGAARQQGGGLPGTVEALQAQVDTAERIERVIQDTRDRLRLLDARLDEAVVRALELSVQATAADQLGDLGNDVDGVVGEMEALRQALEETGGGTPAAGTA